MMRTQLESPTTPHLSYTQLRIIKSAQSNPGVTVRELQGELHVARSTAIQAVRQLITLNYAYKVGRGVYIEGWKPSPSCDFTL